MARPRKDSKMPDARERIIAAFWELLSEHYLPELSASMIADAAQCNRGTFYYYFTSVDQLVDQVVEEEVINAPGLPQVMLYALSNEDGIPADFFLEGGVIWRISLLVARGGFARVHRKIQSYGLVIWQRILCRDGEELKPEARLVVNYAIGAILGILHTWVNEGRKDENPRDLWSKLAGTVLAELGEIQGVSVDEILTRLDLINTCLQLREYDPAELAV